MLWLNVVFTQPNYFHQLKVMNISLLSFLVVTGATDGIGKEYAKSVSKSCS